MILNQEKTRRGEQRRGILRVDALPYFLYAEHLCSDAVEMCGRMGGYGCPHARHHLCSRAENQRHGAGCSRPKKLPPLCHSLRHLWQAGGKSRREFFKGI